MTIGELLTTARNEAGLSVAEISERTRIRPHVIEAVEGNDFAICGGDVYARGHIRTLATTLDLDPTPLLAEYDDKRGTPPPATIKEVFTAGNGRVEPRSWNWSAVMAGLLVVAVAYGGFRLASATDHRTPQRLASTIAVTPSTPPAPATATPRQPGGSPGTYQDGKAGGLAGDAAGREVATKPTKAVEVKVFATDDATWLSVTGTNGKQLFRGTLPAGESKKFTDDKVLTLVVGNAAAVRLVVNGEDVGGLGKRGEVVRLIYRPGDPEAKG